MSSTPDKAHELYLAAVELDSATERTRFVEQACAGDAELRARVEALLREFEGDHGFMQRAAPTASPALEKPGDRIGRYKLLQQIGEGGCGIVYMAEQEEPVRRRVALKVIKLGMDTKSVIARFEAERQALALMDHPNIAKVLDAGATDTGRPYFVMELVRGVRITDYCDETRLSTRDRLNLFTQVCHAVQHAHQKGIIHRDLKPSNILVTINDGAPVPKVIDFGIAKATTQQRLTDKTLFTAFEQFIGTPAYMSPEQAVMTSLDIDTRSDIYSLGVLLYELLTGKTPFDTEELLAAGLDEMRRTIREKEPAHPSTRLSTMLKGELTTTANHRGAEALKLISMVRGDLDWIVMKALEKDRTRRYGTANDFAQDITRHLSNEPVAARPPSSFYKLQKLIHRNKGPVAAATAVVLALLAGLGLTTWQSVRATRAERVANQQRERAEKEARRADLNAKTETMQREAAEHAVKKSRAVLDFIQHMLTRSGDSYPDQVTVLQMLNLGAADAGERFRDQPDVSAAVQYSIGFCYSKIGHWDTAEKYLQRALRLQEQLFGYENPDTLDIARELASVALSQHRNADAKVLTKKVLESAQTAFAKSEPSLQQKQRFRQLELWASRKLCQSYIEQGKLTEAAILAELLVSAVKNGELVAEEAGHAWDELGQIALAEGRPQEALKAFETAQTFYGKHNIVQNAWSDGMRGAAYLAMGDYKQAESLITNSLPVLRGRFGDPHFRVQRAFRDLVSLYSKTGQPDQAAECKQRLIDLDRHETRISPAALKP